MIRNRALATLALAASLSLAAPCPADELRNLKPGDAVPGFSLATIAGTTLESSTLKGSVTIVVYLTAEQRASELAAADSTATFTPYAVPGRRERERCLKGSRIFCDAGGARH